MGDVRCAVCGDKWEQYGINHGDMAWWQADLLRAGAGCPSCEGERDGEDHFEEFARDVVFDAYESEQFEDALHAAAAGEAPPKWEEPEPKVLWTCAGCGVSAVVSNEAPYDGSKVSDDPLWFSWHGGQKTHYSHGAGPHAYSDLYDAEEPERDPPHEIAGKAYCPGCAGQCAECSASVFSNSDLEGEAEEAGSSFPHPINPFCGSVCYDCYCELNAEEEEEEPVEDEEEEARE